MGLDEDSFSTIRSQILALDPLSSPDKIFNMVQQEENHKRMMTSRDREHYGVAAFDVTQPNKADFQLQGDRSICGHCMKTGHVESAFYELIGYPPGWNVQGGQNSPGGGRAGREKDRPTLAVNVELRH